MSRDCFRGEGNRTRLESSHTVLELRREMSVTTNQPIYRRTKKPAVDLLAQQLERARESQRSRERIAEKEAEAFRAEQRAAQGYAASQIFGPTQTERDADREIRLSALRDRIRIVSHEELSRM